MCFFSKFLLWTLGIPPGQHVFAMSIPSGTQANPPRQGFALIVTLSVTALLVLLVTGLLLVVRAQSATLASRLQRAEARSNAQVGMRLALGALQRDLGSDCRVSAPGSQLGEDALHPALVGVWDARRLDEEMATTLPSGYYDRATGFRRWLVSGPGGPLEDVNYARTGALVNPVTFRRGSAADGRLDLRAARLAIGSTTGGADAFAWLVEDQNLKAPLLPSDLPPVAATPSVAQTLLTSGLPGARGHELIDGFDDLAVTDPALGKAVTTDSLKLVAALGDVDPARFAEEISLDSRSLLTNAVLGGVRHDFSLLLQRNFTQADFPAEYYPSDRVVNQTGRFAPTPSAVSYNGFRLSDTVPAVSDSNSATRLDLDTLPLQQLASYAAIADLRPPPASPGDNRNDGSRIEIDAQGRPRQDQLWMAQDVSPVDAHWRGDGMWLRPISKTMRIREIVYVGAKPIAGGKYRLVFYSIPVVTIWNPYTCDTTIRYLNMQYRVMPFAARVTKGSATVIQEIASSQNTWMIFAQNVPGQSSMVIPAGDCRVFFPDFITSPGSSSSQRRYYLANRWPTDFSLITKFWAPEVANPAIEGLPTESVTVGFLPTQQAYSGMISHYNDGWSAATVGWYQSTKTHDWDYDLRALHPFLLNEGGDSLTSTYAELAIRPKPACIIDLGAKVMDDPKLPSLTWTFDYYGALNPSMMYRGMEVANRASVSAAQAEGAHRAAVMEYRFIPLRGDTDLARYLSTLEPGDGVYDFQGGSHGPGDGANRMIGSELPLVPLHSLAQLQHLPLQDEGWVHDSPIPRTPLWAGTIGNARAHPWLRPGTLREMRQLSPLDTWNPGAYTGQAPIIDRQWVANALLFDGWYFSAAGARQGGYFAREGSERTARQVIDEALARTRPLPLDRLEFTSQAASRVQAAPLVDVNGRPTDRAWDRIGSLLTLRGGFNINSTSVAAWRAVLGAALGKPQARLVPGGGVSIEAVDGVPVSRFSLPIGPNLDEGGDPIADGFTGYRELQAAQIDELAKAVVEEVRARGPFRSLGEFVNRRRTSEASSPLVLRGALESALERDEVSINAPYRSGRLTAANFPNTPFVNPAAVEGWRHRGMAGYVSQADLLTTLGPVMTCRGDTFTVHTQGERLGADGRTGSAVRYEIVVQREADFINNRVPAFSSALELANGTAPGDGTNPAPSLTPEEFETSRRFGRRFRIVSLREVLPESN